MFSTILKALVVIWPFFKTLIFKDRPVAEVLANNIQLTGVFVVLVVVTLMFYVTLSELSETKTTLKVREEEMVKIKRQCVASQINTGEGPLKEEETPFDKNTLMEMLNVE